MKKRYRLICECCGKEQIFDDLEQAYKEGWDYPPYIGEFGLLSPRTCGDCTIDKTVYWKVVANGYDNINSHDIEVIERIKREPESLYYYEE